MIDIVVILLLIAIIIPAVYYIVRAKKKGQVCIGCPNASKCHKYGQCHKSK